MIKTSITSACDKVYTALVFFLLLSDIFPSFEVIHSHSSCLKVSYTACVDSYFFFVLR